MSSRQGLINDEPCPREGGDRAGQLLPFGEGILFLFDYFLICISNKIKILQRQLLCKIEFLRSKRIYAYWVGS